jgi:hypothetical protein
MVKDSNWKGRMEDFNVEEISSYSFPSPLLRIAIISCLIQFGLLEQNSIDYVAKTTEIHSLQFCKPESPRSRCLHTLCLVRDLLPGLQTALYPHMAQTELALFLSKDTNLCHYPSPWPNYPNIIHWRLRFQHANFGGHHIQFITLSVRILHLPCHHSCVGRHYFCTKESKLILQGICPREKGQGKC